MKTPHKSGIGLYTVHTLRETADLMGISRERVRQIEKRALAKIRTLLREKYGIVDLAGFLNQ